jgi:tetratricopeptide (TPR) repeat protein
MSKPMVVTLPFVLLLLDFWPLRRLKFNWPEIQWTQMIALIREKASFFVLSFLGCLVTYQGVKAGGNIIPADMVPWSLRLANVPISYVRYIGKLFWPTNLVILYPMPDLWLFWQTVVAVFLLLTISVFVLVQLRAAPYLAVGWFIFLGTLVPTIGFVQVGFQSIADRYTYIPFFGLFIAVVWGVADLCARLKLPTPLLNTISALVLATCGVLSWNQAGYWRNGTALWSHCLQVAPDSVIVRYNLGLALQTAGKIPEAMEEYRKVLQAKPDHLDANLNLGTAFIFYGQMAQASNYFAKVLRLKPDYSKAHANMGLALRSLDDYQGAMLHCAEAIRLAPAEFGAYLDMARSLSGLDRHSEALYYFTESLRRNPGAPQIHYELGLELLKLGRLQEAASSFGKAVILAPPWPDAHLQLAITLAAEGQLPAATAQYREALKLQPDSTTALNNLAWILATSGDTTLGDGNEAVRLAEHACQLTACKQTVFIGTLAAAYAEAGNFDKAAAASQKACDLATSLGETNLLERNRALLQQFKNHKPYRDLAAPLESRL